MHQPNRRDMLRQMALAGLAGAGALGLPGLARAETGNLEQIKSRGVLTVAVYDDLPPFSTEKGHGGIDALLAQAIAAQLGVKAKLLPFPGGEDMEDDLRFMVWKGHYLGYGPADLMLHVPVEAPLMNANPQVNIFAPYWRERVMVARNREQVSELKGLDALKGLDLGVAGQTLAGWLLANAEGGSLQPRLKTTFKDGVAAAQALLRGEIQVAAGMNSELLHVLAADKRYAVEPFPSPRAGGGWVIGCAVKREAEPLAVAVQTAMNTLMDSGELASIFQSAQLTWRRP